MLSGKLIITAVRIRQNDKKDLTSMYKKLYTKEAYILPATSKAGIFIGKL